MTTKKNDYYKQLNRQTVKKKKVLKVDEIENKNLSKKDLNRRRYENRQHRYSKEKKVIKPDDNLNSTNELINLSITDKKELIVEEKESIALKEKKQHNFFVDNINLEDSKDASKQRVKTYLKESVVYAILITFVNGMLILFLDNFSLLQLFDVKYMNIIITVVLSLLISYLISFFIDTLITEIWVKICKKVGDKSGNYRVK